MDMGSQKTHNVCASASVHEVCLERGPALPRGASPMAVVLGATGGPWVMWGSMEAKEGSSGPRKMEQTLVDWGYSQG